MTPPISEAAVRAEVAPLLTAALPDGFRLANRREFRWSTHFVYESPRSDRSGSKVLVKVLRAEDAQGRRQSGVAPGERAAAEYGALSLLEQVTTAAGDPTLTAVHPFGCRGEIGAVVMEYRPARDLRSLIRAAAGWTASSVLRSSVETAAASAGKLLALVHERLATGPADLTGTRVGLHGDLYPDNVMLDADGRVFFLDTGLDRVGSAAEDLAKFVVGTDSLKERLVLGDTLVRSSALRAVIESFIRGYRGVRPISAPELACGTVLAGLRRWRVIASAASARHFPGASLVARRADSSMQARLQTYVEEWSRTCR
jgi:tRNA A-37 threonylcarbamoyl transferase component Bud32